MTNLYFKTIPKTSPMKFLLFFTFTLLFFSCSQKPKEQQIPPNLQIVNYDTALQKTADAWFYKGKLFSGYMIQDEKNGFVVYKLPIIEGKENGLAKGWYNSGEKLLERNFIEGKKEGIFKQWWPNGNYRYLFNYKNDNYEGKQFVFFPNGKVQQESYYLAGAEEGLQRIWNENGVLISNYTIKNKKLYGVISVKSCMPVTH
jgi:antitoxin component YwqK of YwqJK toxin-antitoxin module